MSFLMNSECLFLDADAALTATRLIMPAYTWTLVQIKVGARIIMFVFRELYSFIQTLACWQC